MRGITNINILESLKSKIEDAMRKGMSVEDFCNDFIKKKTAIISKTQLKTIFNTNVRQVYNLSRYESQLLSDKPYFRYVAINDYRTRQNHAKMHGLILPKSHGFWASNYPPNGFNCRCKVQALSLDEVKALGGKVSKKAPLLNIPNDGFKNGIKPYEEKAQDLINYLNEQVKDLPHEAHKIVNQRIKESLMQLQTTKNNYNKIKEVFKSDDEKQFNGKLLRIGDCDILGQNLPLYVSLENVFTHKHREHISAYDYAIIPQMLKNIKSKNVSKIQSNAEVIVSHLGIYYRLVIKKTSKGEAIVKSITQERKWE